MRFMEATTSFTVPRLPLVGRYGTSLIPIRRSVHGGVCTRLVRLLLGEGFHQPEARSGTIRETAHHIAPAFLKPSNLRKLPVKLASTRSV